ncbi:MAG: ATP phosphoribosyltransferase regulatory subunit [Phycisphaerae bacterium]|nr:ATP phosphoribosyltransferase regulatory subunit [Phycisphaerae bacterium]
MPSFSFQCPPGTRDFYPQDLLRKRYIEKLWRDTSIRHGFEEIDGPTFEHTDLYTVKSGEGIVSEIFGVFSGKDEAGVKEMAAKLAAGSGAMAPYALRPEFTPTLARMYAARAAQLPKPAKWFWMQNCFRAERPQRGRLREFGQWNCDVIGEGSHATDVEVTSCCTDVLASTGLTHLDLQIRLSHRDAIDHVLHRLGVPDEHRDSARSLLDARTKLGERQFIERASPLGLSETGVGVLLDLFRNRRKAQPGAVASLLDCATKAGAVAEQGVPTEWGVLAAIQDEVATTPWHEWMWFDLSIVRGLAYYTGMVFEVIAEGERAIAGGGRYDNLIETFGGPPTPACGFGMGDVVLGNILQDRGLMPEGRDLLEALSRSAASLRPDVFVISNGTPEADAALRPLVARLRRGVESRAWLDRADRKPWQADRYSVPPLHARYSYKVTKNIGKLLQDAAAQHARYAAILEGGERATLKNLDTREERKDVPIDALAAAVCARP